MVPESSLSHPSGILALVISDCKGLESLFHATREDDQAYGCPFSNQARSRMPVASYLSAPPSSPNHIGRPSGVTQRPRQRLRAFLPAWMGNRARDWNTAGFAGNGEQSIETLPVRQDGDGAQPGPCRAGRANAWKEGFIPLGTILPEHSSRLWLPLAAFATQPDSFKGLPWGGG